MAWSSEPVLCALSDTAFDLVVLALLAGVGQGLLLPLCVWLSVRETPGFGPNVIAGMALLAALSLATLEYMITPALIGCWHWATAMADQESG